MLPLEFKSLEKRNPPIEKKYTFKGGSLDGQVKKGTEHYILTDKVIITVNNEQYRYVADGLFEYVGTTHKLEQQPMNLKQKIVSWFIQKLLS